ncbi:fumarylacetoacetate hydrolase family protein [Niveispirillum sp.]|uniref:fumarylacetoacetate hydrolase family protein n=1 Tax=Niveispirillum sp. TaxID=1917217 RepID=UPI001B45AB75|nr:fumarylacetoacetate hydrolase family protein [Niveispirillum sp.]MBP7335976.1 fumarylacetoacetate hydrolase family protein [Niveispirillum sp.]
MKLVTFVRGEAQRLGALVEDRVLDLQAAAAGAAPAFASMLALIEAGPEAWDAARALIAKANVDAMHDLADARLLAPLPRPTRLRDCSLMLEHMDVVLMQMARRAAEEESDPDAAYERLMASGKYALNPTFKKQCVYYNADHTSVSGTEVDIVWPSYSDYIDFELEWACVIGRPARDATRERAAEHIFGYTILNDWSARDVQMPLMYTMNGPGEGKDFPGSWGIGPCIVTPDEIGDPYDLTMTATINGVQWTRGTTGSMYHRFEDAIAQFSREKTILPGEVLGSGTVLGGCGFELGRKLSPGDLVELEVQNIGVLRNRVVRAS